MLSDQFRRKLLTGHYYCKSQRYAKILQENVYLAEKEFSVGVKG